MTTSTGRCQDSTSSSTTMLPPASRMMPSLAVTPKTTLPMTLPTPISGAPLRVGSTVRKMSSMVSTRVAMVAPKRVAPISYSARMPSVP